MKKYAFPTIYTAMNRFRGFTLVELIITMALVAVLLALAVPGMTPLIRSNRLATEANKFITMLNFARSEAIKRNSNVDVVAAGGSWTGGLSVSLAADGTVLRTANAIRHNFTLTTVGGVTTLQYLPSGRSNVTETFVLCETSGEPGRQIDINITGRISVQTIACP